MSIPFLTGEKVMLRSIEASDLTPEYRDWFNDAEVCAYNSHHRFPNYGQDMDAYYNDVIQSKHNLILAICDITSKKHIGNIALENIDALNQSAEFAIVIGDTSFWGKGIGGEATRLIIRHGFEELNLHRIYCGTAEDNLGLQKLAISVGFKEEGRLRDDFFKGGTFKDIIRYGLLREEFKK